MQKAKLFQGLPVKPGVYLFKDASDKVLYIGKALNIKNRVKNHFREKNVEIKKINLLKKTKKIDYIETKSEIESLLLEARLIKQYRPWYNVSLKDDKRYLYVGMTREKYPRIFLLRQPETSEKLLVWFGPFPTGQSLKEILRLIRRIFPYRSCQKLLDKFCLFYHLNLCPGVCVKPDSNYRQTMSKLRLFFSGQTSQLASQLKKQMIKASDETNFEKAGELKKQIQMFEKLLLNFKRLPEEEAIQKQLLSLRKLLVKKQGFDPVVIHRLEAYDVANLGEQVVVGSLVVFIQGEPSTVDYRQFKIRGQFQGDPAAIAEILSRRLKHPEWLYPQLILVDGGKTQVSAVFEVLVQKKLVGQVGLLGLVKKEEKIIVPRISREKITGWEEINFSPRLAGLRLLQYARDEAHRFSQRYYRKLHRQITFSAPK